jgi:iron complex outermembrane receptor protein
MSRLSVRRALAALLVCSTVGLAAEDSTPPGPRDALFDLSLEALMEIPVTSVGRKEAPLSRSAAAVAVITHDDIRRLGITSLPEALRLVPGLEVARIGSHSWAIAARGFNSQYSDKLLVLLDGRILYEARFPGVYWDAQDVVLEDVERIEVIRGPGAALWGANAVNGVINIITRTPADAQGALVSTAIGSEERPTTSVRYGGTIGRAMTYRVHGKLTNRAGLTDPEGGGAMDAWDGRRIGGRLDWETSARDRVTVQSDTHVVAGREFVTEPRLMPPFSVTADHAFSNEAANVLGRWRRQLSPGSELALQAYYADSTQRENGGEDHDHLADVELTHRFSPAAHHDVVWGGGYRRRHNRLSATLGAPEHTRHLQTAFLQDEIALSPDRLYLTLGTKLEHNSDTGLSVNPSVRVLWIAHASHTVWGAVSRAVRTPDLFELGAEQPVAAFPSGPGGPIVQLTLVGRPALSPESVVAYELGYRATPSETVSVEIAGFYNRYDSLIAFVEGESSFRAEPVPHVFQPLVATNPAAARTVGYEVSGRWAPTAFWRISPSYTFLRQPGHVDLLEFDSPSHRAALVSSLTLPRRTEVNGALYRVGALESAGVPAYTRLDLGLTWRPRPHLELGVWGQNLTDERHVEFFGLRTEHRDAIKRAVVAQITWRR